MTSTLAAKLPQEILSLIIQSHIDPFTVEIEEAIPFPSRTRPKLISKEDGGELEYINLKLASRIFCQEVDFALRKKFDGRLTFRGDDWQALADNFANSTKLERLHDLIEEVVTDSLPDEETEDDMVLLEPPSGFNARKWTIRVDQKAPCTIPEDALNAKRFLARDLDFVIKEHLWRTLWGQGYREALFHVVLEQGYEIVVEVSLQMESAAIALVCRAVVTHADAHGEGLIFKDHEVVSRAIAEA